MTYTEQTRAWVEEHLAGTAQAGILAALEQMPIHLAPRVQLNSHSPWAFVDAVPGPRLAVWLVTGAVYEVRDDGSVGDDPIAVIR